jgi:hypothetical protein
MTGSGSLIWGVGNSNGFQAPADAMLIRKKGSAESLDLDLLTPTQQLSMSDNQTHSL